MLLASMSPLWTRREKALLIGLVPVGWVLGAVPGRFNGGDLVITGAVGSTALFARVLPRLVLRGRSRG